MSVEVESLCGGVVLVSLHWVLFTYDIIHCTFQEYHNHPFLSGFTRDQALLLGYLLQMPGEWLLFVNQVLSGTYWQFWIDSQNIVYFADNLAIVYCLLIIVY